MVVAARRLAGTDPRSLIGNFLRLNASHIPTDGVSGNSGFRADLVDDFHVVQHFVAFLTVGYFHPILAERILKEHETPDRSGTVQDIRSGLAAISLGRKVRNDQLTIDGLMAAIPSLIGDPSNGGILYPEPDYPGAISA